MPKVLHLTKQQVFNRCKKLCRGSLKFGMSAGFFEDHLTIYGDHQLALVMTMPAAENAKDTQLKLNFQYFNKCAWVPISEVTLLNPFRMPVKKTANTCTLDIYSNCHGNHALWTIITINREGDNGKITIETHSVHAVPRKPRTRK